MVSISLGGPSVDTHHHILPLNFTLCLSQLLVPCNQGKFSSIHWIGIVPYSQVAWPILFSSPYWPWVARAMFHKFWSNADRGVAECWWQVLCLLALPFHHTDWDLHIGSNSVANSTHVSLNIAASHILLEVPRDWNPFGWWCHPHRNPPSAFHVQDAEILVDNEV